ncbi:MAG: DUF5627 domain-containing protein [Paludibacter sp.]|nr:DUF5627 domain-containing protein [Paludibacter sp.]
MKKIFFIIGAILFISVINSCKNEDWSFPDFDYTTSYFPYQYPVRTLVLGDYNFDNSLDNDLKFNISATMGGVYKNEKDILVKFEVDNSLANHLFNLDGETPILPLPERYYTLSNKNQIVIPKGKYSGSILVQLTDDFLSDSLAVGINYVIPLRIISATTDSVLKGKSDLLNPDPRIADNWIITPKNFTLFGIKFVNQYDGTYLLRGKSTVKDASGNIIETNIYRKSQIENDEIVLTKTISRSSISYSNAIRLKSGSPGKFNMDIFFNSEGIGTIKKIKGSMYEISGSSKFIKNGDKWGGVLRNVIYLNYEIKDGLYTHIVNDTLVFRNKNVKFEQFSPLIK